MDYCRVCYHDEEGFTLVAVLGFTLLLAMVLTPFALSARISALTSAHVYDLQSLTTSADAVNTYLAWLISNDAILQRDMNTRRQTSFTCAAGDIHLQITVQPHSSLINLNTADLPALSKGLEDAGISIADAETLATQIIQYRMRSDGSKTDQKLPYGMKHSPFEDIAELHEWPLLRKTPLLHLSRFFSVGSGTATQQTDFVNVTNNHFTLQTDIFYHNRSVTAASYFEISPSQGRSAKTGEVYVSAPSPRAAPAANCPGELVSGLLPQLQIALP